MKRNLKYFIFNKAMDYERGFLQNMEFTSDGLGICEESKSRQGVFISRILDSGKIEMEWHRLILKLKGNNYGQYKITVCATNDLYIEQNGMRIKIENELKSIEHSMVYKWRLMNVFVQKSVSGMNDILLHEVKGRYMWFVIEVYHSKEQKLFIEELILYFPKRTFIDLLPEIYHSNDRNMFLERYLGIFQSLYEDMNQKIAEIPDLFDIMGTDYKLVTWIAEWLNLTNSYMWSEEQFRTLVTNAIELYRLRGTKRSISEFVKLFTGEEPYIIENHDYESLTSDKAHSILLAELYGNSHFIFTVIVKEDRVSTEKEYKTLIRIIEEVKPIHMELNLVVLKTYIFLNRYSYLGINSVLGQFRDVVLDGQSLLPFAVIGESG